MNSKQKSDAHLNTLNNEKNSENNVSKTVPYENGSSKMW